MLRRVVALAPRLEGSIWLRHGRSIGFAEYGVPLGTPVLWFHGTPGGRHQIPPAVRLAAGQRGVRLIALERPGAGTSTRHVYSSVLGWADDVEEVTNHLGLPRFALIGLSGGGPYVLACAYRLRERVVAGAVLGGVAPARGDDAIPGGLMAVAVALSPSSRPRGSRSATSCGVSSEPSGRSPRKPSTPSSGSCRKGIRWCTGGPR